MAYQTDTIALNAVDQVVSVTFPTPFSSAPEVILPFVQNTSGAVTVLDIRATVVNTPTATGFDVLLSVVPDTADYELVYIAGSMAAVFEAISQGQKISGFPAVSGALAASDKLIILRFGPYIKTELINWEDFQDYFPNVVAIPTAPTTAGVANQVALPSAVSPWLFLHNGTQWTRIPVDAGAAWTGENVLTKYREGVTALSNGVQSHAVTFSSAFDIADVPTGTELAIKCTLRNLSGVAPISMLHGMVVAQSRTGFTYLTNAPTDTTDFELVWDARLRTDS